LKRRTTLKAAKLPESSERKSATEQADQEVTRPHLPLRSRLRSSRASGATNRTRARTVSFRPTIATIQSADFSDGEESCLSEAASEMYEPLSAEEVLELQREFSVVRRRMAAKVGTSIDAGSNDPWLGEDSSKADAPAWQESKARRSESSIVEHVLPPDLDLLPDHCSAAPAPEKRSRSARSRFATDLSSAHSWDSEPKAAPRSRFATDMSAASTSSALRRPTLSRQRLAPGLAEGNAPPRRLTLFANKSRANTRMSDVT